ncbi:sugar-binding transcriptional regulator [Clostridium sp. CX1]|uniref:Sugar-binding domain-containing protein n=1 Tax=Clostridium tanneri TaxID=3037988 RepID=A0ABU4JS40_9CLOT|nr:MULTISPECIES: sugar-binding domain-containing protein [unclassified Clostridium]MCT8975897.1 sugar-binding transcriptional regulator [Clostridium sp. CX1]MDW8800753.1 sugar-binding domain-containing protein [Clostridium sp. A1-XYC3]
MEDVLKLQQKIVPELVELLEKRYNILRTIYYNQPIGRRVLANNLEIGERIVRTEINFLKGQNFIEINTPGMTITKEGEEIIDKLKDFIHAMKGLSEIEKFIKDSLMLKKVIVVPGNLDEDKTVVNEIGRAAAGYLKSIIADKSIIAITGGSTIKELIDNMPKMSSFKDILVVPARGGMGRNIETQANTLAEKLASKLEGNYRLLHVPDNLSDKAMSTIIQEKDVKDILDTVYNANILIYGIGRADEMSRRRGLISEEIQKIENSGAVGEAFGYYHDEEGKIVYSTPSIGIRNEEIGKIDTLIAVAGGKEKAEAIISIQKNYHNSVLVTDEGAAREIMELLK